MGYRPKFTITTRLSAHIADIAAMREKLSSLKNAVVSDRNSQSSKGTRRRQIPRSSGAERMPLTLERIYALANGEDYPVVTTSREQQVLDYFASWRRREKNRSKGHWTQEDLLQLHRIVATGEGMDQGVAGQYRTIAVRTGKFVPPPPDKVPQLMFDLLEWRNTKARKLPPALTSAILHYRLSDIHPFSDGNGRFARALALWELYRNGFAGNLLPSLNGHYWGRRRQYYAALRAVNRQGGDLTVWLEYSAQQLKQELKREWIRARRDHG